MKSIATTTFQEAGLPITTGKCAMHRQASFYANQWPEGTKVAEDGDVFAFYFPAIDAGQGQAGAGRAASSSSAFADRPEVQAVQTYLASAEYANSRAKLGNWVIGEQQAGHRQRRQPDRQALRPDPAGPRPASSASTAPT